MHPYVPLTGADRQYILQTLGVESVEDLFAPIPESLRKKAALNLPPMLSELEVTRLMTAWSRENADPDSLVSFVGGGAYRRFIPALVGQITNRGEFLTAYTPYQPEVSQGTLQVIYEFQSLICALTGLEVANASMYDGASATAEAVLMAQRVTRRNKAILASSLHPNYRKTARTYTQFFGTEFAEVPWSANGTVDIAVVKAAVDEKTSCLIVQSPNFLGAIESLEPLAEICRERGALLVHAATDPMSLALLKEPGKQGVDIFVGEGQGFGLPLNFGGPYLGLFATRKTYIRQMPGRLCGRTVDADGKPGFVLTLATREQHIRREKATSNICTNVALCALMSTLYLTTLGKNGLRDTALRNLQAAAYLKQEIAKIPGYKLPFDAPTFNEFTVEASCSTSKILEEGMKRQILPGLSLNCYYPGQLSDRHLLVCATEMTTAEEAASLLQLLKVCV